MSVTPEAVVEFIAVYRRIHGQPPKLRDCADHFDAKVLNILMCLWEAEDRGLVDRESLKRTNDRRRGI